MDANFFRLFCRSAGEALTGARIGKVFFPGPGLWTLALSGAGARSGAGDGRYPKYVLGGRANGRFVLFFSAEKPENPESPDPMAMWLRKRLRNRRILSFVHDWPSRALALALSPGEGAFLLVDPARGLRIENALPEGFGAPPSWPVFEDILSDPGVWKDHPQITPALRRVCAALTPSSGRRLVARLMAGEERQGFLYAPESGPRELLPFELPGSLGAASLEAVFDDPLEAAAAFGRPILFAAAEAVERKARSAEDKARAKKARRLAQRLDQDAARMRRFIEEGAFGRAIAANLHALDARAKAHVLELPGESGESGEPGETLRIRLDPSKTILENMERFFARAAKGKRGLAHVERLRAAPPQKRGERRDPERSQAGPEEGAASGGDVPKKYQGEPVNLYRTSDGYLAVRGKNAKANDRLLAKLAGPHDLWFHVADGPGAHVILRRDHPGQEPPRRSLEEAAALAALASCKAGSAKTGVMMAHVRDVRKFKGAAKGQVAVDKVAATFHVRLDEELEAALRLS